MKAGNIHSTASVEKERRIMRDGNTHSIASVQTTFAEMFWWLFKLIWAFNCVLIINFIVLFIPIFILSIIGNNL
jgi:hypothetical protein